MTYSKSTKKYVEKDIKVDKVYKLLDIEVERIPKPHKETFIEYARSFKWPKMEIQSPINLNVSTRSSNSTQN